MTYFELHQKFSEVIFHREKVVFSFEKLGVMCPFATLWVGYSHHDRFNSNFALVDILDLNFQNIKTMEDIFEKYKMYPLVLISDMQKGRQFVPKFIQAGYKLDNFDSYMVLDVNSSLVELDYTVEVVPVTEANWVDFNSVADTVFDNQKKQDLMRSLIFSDSIDHHNQSYICYIDGRPAGCGSVLISKNLSAAYLHDDATLPEFRGKKLQKQIIKKRVEFARSLGMKNIYACTSLGSTSFENYLKMGFIFGEQNYALTKKSLEVI